jgi:hypothetical protein
LETVVDSLIKFLAFAFQDGAFEGEHSAEELLAKLSSREDCSEDTVTFLRHSAKTGLLNLSVCEILSGKRSEAKREAFGLDYLQAKLLVRSLPDRVEHVMREARQWEHLRNTAAAA